jgi:D-glycero-alpha-D-manno-heptose-7-phosphate kinase
LEDNLLLFYTGKSRSASNILKDQDDKSKSKDKQILDNLQYIKELGLKSRDALINGNLLEFSNCMNDHWEYKKSRSPGISSKDIDEAFQYARQNGASGGKLVGAGGGGFLMFYANDIEKLRAAMYKKDMPEVRFKFDFEGTAVVLHQ